MEQLNWMVFTKINNRLEFKAELISIQTRHSASLYKLCHSGLKCDSEFNSQRKLAQRRMNGADLLYFVYEVYIADYFCKRLRQNVFLCLLRLAV